MNPISLFYPVKTFSVLQPFGVNGQYYREHGINIAGHNGLDLLASHGQPVYAAHDGVCYPEIDSSGGNGVVIRSLVPFAYNGEQVFMKSIYWHLMQADAVVHTGQHVRAGDLIGYADSTGFSTGDHLHFGLKPQKWDETNWTWYNTEQTNGYLGAVDAAPYFNGSYAQDLVLPHEFNVKISYGDNGAEVVALQKVLQVQGFFPATQVATGQYGAITAKAVLDFQMHYQVASVIELLKLEGKLVGPATRAALNKLTINK